MREIFEQALDEVCREKNVPSYMVYDGSENYCRDLVEELIADKMGISVDELLEDADYQSWAECHEALS